MTEQKELTQEYLKEILYYSIENDYWTWRVSRARGRIYAGMRAGSINHYGYLCVKIDGKAYLAHRLRHLYLYGVWPENEIDHKNRNPSDNSEGNNRQATRSQNKANVEKHCDNTSGFKGVTWRKNRNKWQVQIGKDNNDTYLGLFTDIIDGAKAYDRAAIFYFGEFSCLNFPELKEQYLKELAEGKPLVKRQRFKLTKEEIAAYAAECNPLKTWSKPTWTEQKLF